jgi:hypothetical protein
MIRYNMIIKIKYVKGLDLKTSQKFEKKMIDFRMATCENSIIEFGGNVTGTEIQQLFNRLNTSEDIFENVEIFMKKKGQ